MTEKIIIAGFGGQGVMLLGKVLAEAAMREGRFVTWFPAYGAEVRGGTAHCMVIISDQEIGSPYIGQADTLIALNGPSLEKFKSRLEAKGLLILNSSLARAGLDKGLKAVEHPFTEIASGLGNIRVANMIALGAFLSLKNIVGLESVEKVISDIAPEDKKGLIAINQKALREGARLNG
ncbi:MAG: 2-oxoacid:ferredoxin oxidoreductase subunit gamma [Candidatus Omnitrophica bacterium]|nr:2-oxoacid:ferredoxin oxidoreductase subunit gamma [Candidatus Omnitrophota bacterium]